LPIDRQLAAIDPRRDRSATGRDPRRDCAGSRHKNRAGCWPVKHPETQKRDSYRKTAIRWPRYMPGVFC